MLSHTLRLLSWCSPLLRRRFGHKRRPVSVQRPLSSAGKPCSGCYHYDLLKEGGVNRVLHSAAALRRQYGLRGKRAEEFAKAYGYLRERMRYMDYGRYRHLGVPLGSGVTEASCKTVYGQRLKLSGMRWQKAGAQVVLNLRVLQLSGVWQQAYQRVLEGLDTVEVRGQSDLQQNKVEQAA